MSDDCFRRIAAISLLASTLSILILTFSVPVIFYRTSEAHKDIEVRSMRFKDSSEILWGDLMNLRSEVAGPVQFFSRPRRQTFGPSYCRGCFSLACPSGMPGPPGDVGPDGLPGNPGLQGKAGDDGYDVQLESEMELPCVVCPAGPPGPRGSQGERGLSGNGGMSGDEGPDGNPGIDGPHGPPGPPGKPGKHGPPGPVGFPGDQAIAGIGIKGPKGPAGPRGPKGPPGPHGKSSVSPGENGKTGEPGGRGAIGASGAYGQDGPYGSPGEPGMPASYCPSDCGVQNILADVFPTNKRPLSEYAPPPGLQESPRPPATNDYASELLDSDTLKRFQDLPDFERKLRRKILLRKLRAKKLKTV